MTQGRWEYDGPRPNSYTYPEAETVCQDTAFDKQQPIPSWLLRPHYSDSRFWQGKKMTAFLAPGSSLRRTGYGHEEVDGAHYIYSDRFAGEPSWRDAYAAAQEKVGNDASAAFFEEALRMTLADPTLELRHIISGVNTGGNGFDYQVFGVTTEQTGDVGNTTK